LEVYRNKIASNNLAIEVIKQEYEQKMYNQKAELNQLHQAELATLEKEESNRQFTDQVRIGAIKDKLKAKYASKIQAFQRDVEDTRTALHNKKLHIQGSVDRANREITTLRLQQESTARLHQDALKQREEHASELRATISDLQASKQRDEELIRNGIEIAALVIHMHQKARPLSTEDLDVEELYKYLNVTAGAASSAADGTTSSTVERSTRTVVPTAFLQKALQSSKVKEFYVAIIHSYICEEVLCLIRHVVCAEINSSQTSQQVKQMHNTATCLA
jgi:hypothetical protein